MSDNIFSKHLSIFVRKKDSQVQLLKRKSEFVLYSAVWIHIHLLLTCSHGHWGYWADMAISRGPENCILCSFQEDKAKGRGQHVHVLETCFASGLVLLHAHQTQCVGLPRSQLPRSNICFILGGHSLESQVNFPRSFVSGNASLHVFAVLQMCISEAHVWLHMRG